MFRLAMILCLIAPGGHVPLWERLGPPSPHVIDVQSWHGKQDRLPHGFIPSPWLDRRVT